MIVPQNKVSNTYSILAHIFLPFKKANNYLGTSYMFVPSGKAVFASNYKSGIFAQLALYHA